MLLTVVGCSGSVSGPASPASCYLVQTDGFSLVLDLGPGSLGALYRYLDPGTVDAVGLSHLHPDHCLDLCALYVAVSYSPGAPFPPIPVYGPAGTAERIARAYVVPGAADGAESTRLSEAFRYRDWADEQVIGPFTVSTTRVAHPVPAYAIKVSDPAGGALVFTGDTGPTPVLAEFARGVDLLLAEAAFAAGGAHPPDLHLTGAQAADIAESAGVGRLVLTHIPPWNDPQQTLADARARTRRPIDLAAPGLSWTV